MALLSAKFVELSQFRKFSYITTLKITKYYFPVVFKGKERTVGYERLLKGPRRAGY